MKTAFSHYLFTILVPLVFIPGAQASGQVLVPDDFDLLRLEIQQIRSDYEARISALEQRLGVAEQVAEAASATASLAQSELNLVRQKTQIQEVSSALTVAPDNSFNPAIGVIFQGQVWSFDQDFTD